MDLRPGVAIFIVLSGFSLGLGPARSGWRLTLIATYARRRPWRILPPYWAALGFSLVMTWYVLPQPRVPAPIGKSAMLLVRRVSARVMVALVAAIVVTVGVLGPHVAAGERTRSRPWAGYALAAAVPAIVLMVVKGSVGSCSYSLYLTHAPIVAAVSLGLVGGRVTPGTPMFFVLVAILLPVTVCFAQMFATAFELPFQRHHGWIPLRQAMSARLCRWRRDAYGSTRG